MAQGARSTRPIRGQGQRADVVDPDRHVLAGEIGERVDQTMVRLTTLERAAFVLRHIEGMSIHEIGMALGLNTSATKHSIFRAVRKMRAALAPFKEGVGCCRSR